ncbi:MAG TPA: TetR family transcriptional regulator [Oceanospirillales bacterium]|jgi:DNA-binding transcriptional regulator YbjK|nr:TetR family transcriptional regulator [Oceanospirillales bacterium]|tara:strand:+ start:782 stop:1495 length:714 start_codon:yes stop_codon:yes gene_type:complete
MIVKKDKAALNPKSDVKYQGRKTSRAGSEQRRRLILEAALRIVIREGVRGIRHRAVAKEADVPLAATTYYFKDIQELINDTFAFYAEQALEVVNQFSMRLYEPLSGGDGKSFIDVIANSEGMLDIIADNMAQYVIEQITQHRDALIAEQAFRYEAILNLHLRKLGREHKQALMQKLLNLMALVQSPNPLEDANIVVALIHRMEYEGLLVEPDQLNREEIKSTFLRQLTLMFAVKGSI